MANLTFTLGTSGGGSFDFTYASSDQGTSTFTVESTRTTCYVGEPIMLAVDGNGGWTLVANARRDITCLWDFDDAGATFTYGTDARGDNQAERAFGRVVCKAWDTPGTKTVTLYSYVHGSGYKSQTVTITVQAIPDDSSFDEVWYVSWSGDTTGFPTETGNVTHITSYSEWAAADDTLAAGNTLKIVWQNETHTVPSLGADVQWSQDASLCIVTKRDSAGSNPVINGGSGTARDFQWLYTNYTGGRFILRDIDFEGGYSPITGQYAGVKLSPFDMDTADNITFAASNCRFDGIEILSSADTSGTATMLYDCASDGWKDYVVFCATNWQGFAGCAFLQDPLACTGDDKPGTDPDWADHAAWRVIRFSRFCAHNSILHVNNGWSSFPPEFDNQPSIRLHQSDSFGGVVNDYIASIQDNLNYGARLFYWQGPNDTATITGTGGNILVEGNKCIGNRATFRIGGALCSVSIGGVIAQNNVVAVPDLTHSRDATVCALIIYESKSGPSAGAEGQPAFVRFNTLYSEVNATGEDLDAVQQFGSGGSFSWTTDNNVLAGDSHQNSASIADEADLSPADDFAPVTSGSGDASATGSTFPFLDFNRTKRAATPKQGAIETTVSSRSELPQPSNSVAPTISVVSGSRTQTQVTDLGTWSNLTPYVLDFNWQVGGSTINAGAASGRRPFYLTDAGDTGTLTCTVGTSAFNGRVTATSNGLSV